MASDQSFVDFIIEQGGAAGVVSSRKMFGEYALYCDGKVIALVCDNRLFVKPTAGGRSFVGTVVEGSPYPGAKPCLVVEAGIEDRDWLTELFRITARELPMPPPKKVRVPRGAGTTSRGRPRGES